MTQPLASLLAQQASRREFIDSTGSFCEAEVIRLLGVPRRELRVFTDRPYQMPTGGFEFVETEEGIEIWTGFDGMVGLEGELPSLDLSTATVTTEDLRALCRAGWRLMPTGDSTWRARRLRASPSASS